MSDASPDTGAKRTGEDLLIGVCGFVTSLVTAAILWWVELELGLAFYTWMFWFVLPVGALLSGFAGASGYYAGARIFNHRPTRVLLLNILLVSVGTFFMIHYLSYITLEIDGRAVSDYVSFGQYMDVAIRSASMEFRHNAREIGATGELGGLGYGVAILQILGFAAGGLAMYRYLVSIPYCERCSQYFSRTGKQTRYASDAEALQASTAQIASDFGDDAIASAIEKHGTFGNPKFQRGNHLRSVIDARHCKKCGEHRVKYLVQKQSGKDWEEVLELTTAGFTTEALNI